MQHRDLREALLSALQPTGSEPDPAAGRQLAENLCPVADGALAAARRRVLTEGSSESVRVLAGNLARRAADDARLRQWLFRWLDGRPRPPAAHGNAIGGAAQLWGPTVQARDVQGGVHFHHSPAPASQRPPTPRQLPPVSPHFVGREEEVSALDRQRAGHPSGVPQVIVVSGPAGIGKTTLASRWVGGLAAEFPDGQLYADLAGHGPSGPQRPGEILEPFLRALGVDGIPSGTAEQIALWRSFTAGLRLAVLLDNALTAAQVRPLLPGTADSLTVVTSRRQLTGLVVDGAVLHQVGPLEPAAAVELLDRGGGRRVTQDPEAAQQVVKLCARLPLAVCLAAAQLAARPRQPLAAMAATLSRGHGPLDALRVEGEAAIRLALDESYRLLPPEAARAYRRLSLVPVSRIDRGMAAAACGLTTGEADGILDVLVETNLLQDLGPRAAASTTWCARTPCNTRRPRTTRRRERARCAVSSTGVCSPRPRPRNCSPPVTAPWRATTTSRPRRRTCRSGNRRRHWPGWRSTTAA